MAGRIHARLFRRRARADRSAADLALDLDLDSIDAADIVLQFNQNFGRKIDVRSFRSVRTIEDALAALFALEK